MISNLWQDVRFTGRLIRKQPAFFLAVVTALALGLGANAAVFSVVNSVLLLPLPFSEPDRLFLIRGESQTGASTGYSYPDFLDLRGSTRSFQAIAAWRGHGTTLAGSGEPEFLAARQASAGLFRVLGVRLALGREFSVDEDRPGAEAVAIISDSLWKRRLSQRPDVIGARVMLDDKPHLIIGVLPADFNLFGNPSVYTPLGQFDDASMRGRRFRPGIWAVGRLANGVPLATARSELSAISQRLADQFPGTNNGWQFITVSLRDSVVGHADRTLLLFAAAAGLVLLIACANVANLFLARTAARYNEFAIRAAIGATRLQIVRQVMTESLIVSLAGGGLGLIVGSLAVRLISVGFIAQTTALANQSLDWRVVFFTIVASILTATLFGLPVALRQEHRAERMLNESTRTQTPGLHRIQAGLVVTQVALAFVLLAGSGLMLRTILNLRAVDMGFDPRSLLTTGVALSPTVKTSPGRIRQAWEEILANVAAIPGVESAALNISLPMQGEESVQYSIGPSGPIRSARVGAPTLEYWKMMRIPLLRGRLFEPQDTVRAPMVAIIDELLAASAFRDLDPVGQLLTLHAGQPLQLRIVGVVRHVRYSNVDEDATGLSNEQLYVPFAQLPDAFLASLSPGMRLVVRTSSNATALERPLRQAVMGAGLNQAVHSLATMEQIIRGTLTEREMVLRLLATFGGLAVVLAAVGVAGVVSYMMSRRFREIGIRIALGAQPSEVLTLVLGQGVTMILGGLFVGIIMWLILMRIIRVWLYQVAPTDSITLIAVALTLAVTAIAATYLGSRRCLRLDPVQVLRHG